MGPIEVKISLYCYGHLCPRGTCLCCTFGSQAYFTDSGFTIAKKRLFGESCSDSDLGKWEVFLDFLHVDYNALNKPKIGVCLNCKNASAN